MYHNEAEPLLLFGFTGGKLASASGNVASWESWMPKIMPGADGLEQKRICERFGAAFVDAPQDLKLGISLSAKEGSLPINGLRHPPERDTTGWYIWGGEELPDDPEFFLPLCVKHLPEWCPKVVPYLGLAPGWRFLIAAHYEDVWFDEALLVYDRE